MSKQHLTRYIASLNQYRRVFKEPELDAKNLSAENVEYLLDRIECDLSPENLTCDGELSGAKLRSRHAMLTGAANQLLVRKVQLA